VYSLIAWLMPIVCRNISLLVRLDTSAEQEGRPLNEKDTHETEENQTDQSSRRGWLLISVPLTTEKGRQILLSSCACSSSEIEKLMRGGKAFIALLALRHGSFRANLKVTNSPHNLPENVQRCDSANTATV